MCVDPASYDHQRARRKAIFLWLRETNEMITQEEVASCTDADYLRALFSLVSGQQLSKACRLAQKNRDHKLALLLSQATRNTTYIRYSTSALCANHKRCLVSAQDVPPSPAE